jgi:hypothetical protein
MDFSVGQLSGGKKNPSTWAGVVSLFAVTHQGPAQGGKAGGSKLPEVKSNKLSPKTQANLSNTLTCASGISNKLRSKAALHKNQHPPNSINFQAQFSP